VVQLPPLRERREDIALIAQRIVDEHAAEGSNVRGLDPEALRELKGRAWPGNVRELRNVLRRAVAMSSGPMLTVQDLQALAVERTSNLPPAMSMGGLPAAGADAPNPGVGDELPIKEARERWVAPMEREYLVRLMKRCKGDLDRAATDAGVHRKSLERLLRQHGLKASDLKS
jgi:DNA-binding NtrC family response regulator